MLPTSHVALLVLVLALGSGTAAAITVSVLRARGVRVAYTRKLFHFTIFTVAAGVHTVWALPGTMVFGTVIVAIVLASLWSGEGHQFYEALARDTDRPHRTLFILVPMLTTALGGLASALLVGPYASVGYLATGWGDAVGEPVGARWGRHPYRVPSLAGVPATRTLEGSLAVFLVASLGSGLALLAMEVSLPAAVGVGVASGAGAAIVEAGSHHGLDNLTVQVAASLIASWLLT